MIKYFSFFLFVLITFQHASAQSTQISGIINQYAAVSAFDTCTGKLQISDTAGFHAGDPVLLIQMQGAMISSANNASFGQVQLLKSAGYYERAIVDSVVAGALYLHNKLRHTYDPAGSWQAVTFPHFTNATVTDTLRPKAWDGITGGVLAFSVGDTLTLQAPILADGAGFRGGLAVPVPGNNCTFLLPQTAYFYETGNWRGSEKGEGVARIEAGKELGRGPQANGGGGGNDHNAGGGGGGHITSGGRGGENDEPNALGCDGDYPGLGGYNLSFSSQRLYLGGGGGAGHANNGPSGAGAAGGGIILLEAGAIIGDMPLISANGGDAATADGDGGGGGGGGGTIRLAVGSAAPNLLVRADGGRGGDSENNNQNRCFGPGGGGGGGRILSNLPGIPTPPGGLPGVVTASQNACNGASNGALAGGPGVIEPLSPWPEDTINSYTPLVLAGPEPAMACTGDQAVFTVEVNPGNWQFQWQLNTGSNWQDIGPGQGYLGFTSNTLTLQNVSETQDGYRYRCLLIRPNCSQTVSVYAVLGVIALPTAGFNTVIDGQTVHFINLSANTSATFWDFGDGSSGMENNPEHIYTGSGPYTILLYAINACDTAVATQVITLLQPPLAGFAVPDSTLDCQSATLIFTNTSSPNATAFTWSFPGGSPLGSTAVSPAITYTTSGTYTAQMIASNAAGADTFTQTFVVRLLNYPVAAFSYAILNTLEVEFTNLSQGGDVYIWDFGDGSPVDTSFSPTHQYAQEGVYTVTLLVTNSCGGSALQESISVILGGIKSNVQFAGALRLFPNPADDILTVDCSAMGILPIELQVFDQIGQLVMRRQKNLGAQTQVSLDGLPAGIYMLRARFAEGVAVRLFVKS